MWGWSTPDIVSGKLPEHWTRHFIKHLLCVDDKQNIYCVPATCKKMTSKQTTGRGLALLAGAVHKWGAAKDEHESWEYPSLPDHNVIPIKMVERYAKHCFEEQDVVWCDGWAKKLIFETQSNKPFFYAVVDTANAMLYRMANPDGRISEVPYARQKINYKVSNDNFPKELVHHILQLTPIAPGGLSEKVSVAVTSENAFTATVTFNSLQLTAYSTGTKMPNSFPLPVLHNCPIGLPDAWKKLPWLNLSGNITPRHPKANGAKFAIEIEPDLIYYSVAWISDTEEGEKSAHVVVHIPFVAERRLAFAYSDNTLKLTSVAMNVTDKAIYRITPRTPLTSSCSCNSVVLTERDNVHDEFVSACKAAVDASRFTSIKYHLMPGRPPVPPDVKAAMDTLESGNISLSRLAACDKWERQPPKWEPDEERISDAARILGVTEFIPLAAAEADNQTNAMQTAPQAFAVALHMLAAEALKTADIKPPINTPWFAVHAFPDMLNNFLFTQSSVTTRRDVLDAAV